MSDSSATEPGRAKRWETPAIDGSSGKGYLTAGRLQELQQQAHEEAFAKGLAEGIAAGSAEVEARCRRLDELLVALAKPFDRLDDTVEKQLVELAMTVVRQLFRRELKLEPSHVIGVVREAIQLLPVASRDIQVHMHPDDAALVRDTLTSAEGDPAWTIVEDPLIGHGGCRVTTENSQIDARAETRLNALIATIAGDERK